MKRCSPYISDQLDEQADQRPDVATYAEQRIAAVRCCAVRRTLELLRNDQPRAARETMLLAVEQQAGLCGVWASLPRSRQAAI